MDNPGTEFLIGLPVAAAVGFLVGWLVRRAGESARLRALEAHWRELLKVAEKARDRFRVDATELAARSERFRKRHEEEDRRLQELETNLKSKQSAVTRLKGETEASTSKLVELERRRMELSTTVERLTAELSAIRDAHAGCADRIRELDSRIEQLQTRRRRRAQARGGNGPEAVDSTAGEGQDDLQAIRGIGPALEHALHEIGVFNYRQFLALTPEEIDRIAARVSNFPARRARYNWADQAKDLHFRKYRERI